MRRLIKLMRRRNNNNILTLTERVFYIRRSIEGIRKIIDECSKVINNPETDEEKRMMALHLLSDANVEVAKGLKALKKVKEQKAAADHDYDYDYGPQL